MSAFLARFAEKAIIEAPCGAARADLARACSLPWEAGFQSMIPKSGIRFSEKIMRKQKS